MTNNDRATTVEWPMREAEQLRVREQVGELAAAAEHALRSGRARAACDHSRSALRLDADHIGALETFVRALWKCGEFAQVVRPLRRLLVLNPYEPGYRLLLGAALQSIGEYGAAARELARADATAALEELRDWQMHLLEARAESDPSFRAYWRRDAVRAMQSAGFDLAIRAEDEERTVPVGFDRAVVYARPS